MARPPKKKAERRTQTLRIRLNEGELKALEVAARASTLELSTWARMVLLGATKAEAVRPAANRANG